MGDPAIKMGPSIGAIPQSDSDSDWGQQEAKAGNCLSGQLTGVSSGKLECRFSARARDAATFTIDVVAVVGVIVVESGRTFAGRYGK